MKNIYAQALTLFCALSLLGLTACNIDSGDEAVRSIGVDLSGFYSNGGGRIVTPSNTGAAVTSLNLVQSGDRLEAVDNNGNIFRGTVGSVVGDQASFNMKGSTTAGNEAVIAGTFSVNGSAATMSGTWAEPALFGSVSAAATVAGIIDSDDGGGSSGTGGVSISGDTGSLNVGATRAFSASGGAAPFSWTLSSTTDGSLSSNAGTRVTYTARNGGSQTVTLRDNLGSTDSVTFTQN